MHEQIEWLNLTVGGDVTSLALLDNFDVTFRASGHFGLKVTIGALAKHFFSFHARLVNARGGVGCGGFF